MPQPTIFNVSRKKTASTLPFAVLVKIVPETFVLHTFVVGDTVPTGPMLYIFSGGIEAYDLPNTPCAVFSVSLSIYRKLGVHFCSQLFL
jgi:hypothetical protein